MKELNIIKFYKIRKFYIYNRRLNSIKDVLEEQFDLIKKKYIKLLK